MEQIVPVIETHFMIELKDTTAFTDALADILRLPDDTLAMTYIYISRYQRRQQVNNSLDPYTLATGCLTLAAKATENPRRLSVIIIPAYTLLHPTPQHPVLIPSKQYDMLRATVVRAEMLLLRVLAFELCVPTPLDFVPRFLSRALRGVQDVGEDFDRWSKEEKEGLGVVESRNGRLERSARLKAVQACKHHKLANLFPSRDVGLGCVFLALEEAGLIIRMALDAWVYEISGGKVDIEDFNEMTSIIRDLI